VHIRAAQTLEIHLFVLTVFTTLGPVTNMYEMPRTMNTKSVIAGLVDRAAGARPRIALIWGTTPEASVLRRKCRRSRPATRRLPGCARRPNR